MQKSNIRVAGLAGLLFGGCAVDDLADDLEVSETSQDVQVANGISLNGISLNGISLNGISLNGISLNGISLNGISLNGTGLNGTSLTAKVGSKWTGTLSNGTSLNLRIDSAAQGTGTNVDVGMYRISYQRSSGWSPLCGVGSDGLPIQAISVPGTWSASAAYTSSTTLQTFACRGKTVAKCVELGYKPWTGRGTHLAACSRMLRGDYCGTGATYTVDGQTLNIFDSLGLQTDAASWDVEAEWTPNGARCISSKKETRFNTTGTIVPPCMGSSVLASTSCGLGFASGALLISELPPPPAPAPPRTPTKGTTSK